MPTIKQYLSITNALANNGYIVFNDFISEKLTNQLYQHVENLSEESFQFAGVGRQNDLIINQQIRNDKTHWLSAIAKIEKQYLKTMELCRIQLNRQLFLGLHDFEAHFARYDIGSFYQRHLDAFKGHSNRSVSTVFYLNPDWSESDGGQLVLYSPNSDTVLSTILPQQGTLVMFLSEQFSHEVLVTQRQRYSIAGWYRTDNPLLLK